jgi:transposase
MPSREASLRNLAKARAKWHPPRPWRSAEETRLIRLLAWQWFEYRGPVKWSTRSLARRLGVSHTYIQKLVREFVTNPSRILREVRSSHPATFEQLNRAQEETRLQKDSGCLRWPRRWKWAEFKIGDQVIRDVVRTKASLEREQLRSSYIPRDVPTWAKRLPYYSPQNPCDPLVEVKYSSMLLAEENRVRPIPFFRRRRVRCGL